MDVGVTAEMGSNLVLSCRALGCPKPAFYWRSMLDMAVHSRAHTQDSLSHLHLGPLGLVNEQAYTCEAKCGSVIKAKQAEVKVFCGYTIHPQKDDLASFSSIYLL